MFFNPLIDVALVSVVVVAINQIMQSKFMDKKLMKEQQDEMKEIQKKIGDLVKRGDQKANEESKKAQDRMMAIMNDMMGKNLKFMAISLAVVLPIFWWLGATYGETVIRFPFSLPFLGLETTWFWWYISCSLVLSIGFMIAKGSYEKFSKKSGDSQGVSFGQALHKAKVGDKK